MFELRRLLSKEPCLASIIDNLATNVPLLLVIADPREAERSLYDHTIRKQRPIHTVRSHNPSSFHGNDMLREDADLSGIKKLLIEYVKSPSLRHIRDPYSLDKLTRKIIRTLKDDESIWKKWGVARETVLKAAAHSWIPVNDLRNYLNELPGPALTETDVIQRLRSYYEEPFVSYPNESLEAGCLAIYEKEKADGTELRAIIGALQDYIDQEEQRIRGEHREACRIHAEQERIALEQRFLSGADCKWTPMQGSKDLYCRINARSYCLSRTVDKRWNLYRIESIEEQRRNLIGEYLHRRDVTKALAQVAYQPEPKPYLAKAR